MQAQGILYPPHSESAWMYERLMIKYPTASRHPSIQPYSRKDLAELVRYVDTVTGKPTYLQRDLQYLVNDNNIEFTNDNAVSSFILEKEYVDSTRTFYTLTDRQITTSGLRYEKNDERKWLSWLYPTPANLLEVNEPYFQLRANLLGNFQVGKSTVESDLFFANQRGAEVYGKIDNRVYFYANLLESQQRFSNYASQYIEKAKAIPGAGSFKYYSSSLFGKINGYDYLNAQGYVGFDVTKHIGVQLGHGKNFIGDGYRSLLLSDFGNNYFYLKLNTKVWKFHYQNIFAELTDLSDAKVGNEILTKKYFAAHYLTFNATPKLSFGFFESVVFNRSKTFDFQYLNPLIFYRTVELFVGSPDNVLIGANARWQPMNGFCLYGQLLLDEFIFKTLKSQNGYWANKYAFQAGVKAVDVAGIKRLDAQLEFNAARPYTYTHFDSASNYVHFNQPLAHPLGTNFTEYIGIIKYRPIEKLYLEARVMKAKRGENDNQNWGGDILDDYNRRPMEEGNTIGQGVKTDVFLFQALASYRLYHNIFLDAQYMKRKKVADLTSRNLNSDYFGIGFRLNLAPQRLDF